MDFTAPEVQKRLIKTFVNSVFLYDNKLTITFNYSGDNSTVTLKDLDNKGPDGFGQCLSCSTLASTSEPVRWFKNVFAITRKIREA